jgi:hypothetical protein
VTNENVEKSETKHLLLRMIELLDDEIKRMEAEAAQVPPEPDPARRPLRREALN